MELRCSLDLAIKLGAISPIDVAQHKALKLDGQHILVRDPETGWPMFWPMAPGLLLRSS